MSIEDPFDQDDWEHYAKMTAEIGEQVQIVGDDLLVTNPKVSRCYYYYCYVSNYVMNDRKYVLTFLYSLCRCSEWRKQSMRRPAMPFF